MTAIERTAYPRFKRILSAKDLEEVYTPTPPFALLDKAAHHVRAVTIRGLYRRVYEVIPQDARVSLEALFTVQPGQQLSPWELLKQEPASPG
jgi:hypothetical protein